jgi:hypothetical protein
VTTKNDIPPLKHGIPQEKDVSCASPAVVDGRVLARTMPVDCLSSRIGAPRAPQQANASSSDRTANAADTALVVLTSMNSIFITLLE